MSDPDLAEANSHLRSFDVTMYRGDDGRYRLWGDINRIQDIIDSGCIDSSPPGAREDLDWFFAHEVDAHIVRCLERLGVQAVNEPDVEIGIGFAGEGPSDEQVTAAFMETYDWYRLPRKDVTSGRTDLGDPVTGVTNRDTARKASSCAGRGAQGGNRGVGDAHRPVLGRRCVFDMHQRAEGGTVCL